jgi:hypothetical protein
MLRNEWEFSYTTEQLADAASAQFAFRNERVLVWEQKKAEVIERIKASGINVQDSLAELMSNNPGKYMATRSHRGAQITIDVTMQADLDECVEKIQEHKTFREQYAAWAKVFAGNPGQSLKLHHDDWVFFFGK